MSSETATTLKNSKLAPKAGATYALVAPPSAHLPLRMGDYEVRLARSEADIIAAQSLRYDAFYVENGAIATPEQAKLKRDIDRFDPHCEHLLVYYYGGEADEVGEPVGTYRMMRRNGAEKTNGFLSSEEYDLSRLLAQEEEILELSRACIAPEHRLTTVMQLLWQGLTSYVLSHEIKYMFGCASFHGTDPKEYAETLSYLYYHHLAPQKIRPKALPEQYIDMRFMKAEDIHRIRVFKHIPSLLKAYLRLGGWVGDGAVIDPVVRTVDACIVVDTANIGDRYYKHYTRKLQT